MIITNDTFKLLELIFISSVFIIYSPILLVITSMPSFYYRIHTTYLHKYNLLLSDPINKTLFPNYFDSYIIRFF